MSRLGDRLTLYSRLQLRSPPKFDGKSALIRRPGFLAGLEESKYHEAFNNLIDCPRAITTYKTFNAHMRDIGGPLAAICEHVYYWVDPVYVKPASSQPDQLHQMDWMRLMSRKLWRPQPELEKEKIQMLQAQHRSKTMKLVQALVDCIEQDIDLWKEEVSISVAINNCL
jgi:hypothetical protein